jgi:biotin carboxylase
MNSTGILSGSFLIARDKPVYAHSRSIIVTIKTRFNGNIRYVVRDMMETESKVKRPLIAVGYGPRCVPVMQLTAAAAELCDLLWLVDATIPEMREMTELLNRFGPVVNIAGLDVDQILKELTAPYAPDGFVTYLDANMGTFAKVAEALGLPFHSVATADALTDKFKQRNVLRAAGLESPRSLVIEPDQSVADITLDQSANQWPAVLKPRSAQGSRYTFKVNDAAHLDRLLSALGPSRPVMVLEDYIADDPSRTNDVYAAYVSVESIVAKGVISHLALTGRFPPAENFRETGFFIPASLSDKDRDAALDEATLAIKALGITTGCLHTEIKFTPTGARVIEVNGRIGGGVADMLRRAADVRLVDLTLRVALGEAVQFDGPVQTQRIGYRFFLQPPDVSATVATIDGIDAVSEFPGVDAITVHQGPGADLDWKDGSRNHILAVVGSAPDYPALLAVDQLLHHEVTVTYADVSHF